MKIELKTFLFATNLTRIGPIGVPVLGGVFNSTVEMDKVF